MKATTFKLTLGGHDLMCISFSWKTLVLLSLRDYLGQGCYAQGLGMYSLPQSIYQYGKSHRGGPRQEDLLSASMALQVKCSGQCLLFIV